MYSVPGRCVQGFPMDDTMLHGAHADYETNTDKNLSLFSWHLVKISIDHCNWP